MAAVQIQGPAFSLLAITPAGIELFRVQGDGESTTVTAPQQDLKDILERLPLGRDLHLIYAWSCGGSEACSVGGGKLREGPTESGWTRTWRGPGGPAVVDIEPGRASLEDPRRGYTLLVVGEEIRVPRR
jgi:hypothetical protein